MGPITPEALGGYKYASKISVEHTKWTEIYLLESKGDALDSSQSFVQSVVIPSGSRVERLGVNKGDEYISNEYKGYCLRKGVSLKYASTNTPQQIGMSERFGRTLAAMARCLLADSGLPRFLWGGADVHGSGDGQQSTALRDQHSNPVRDAKRQVAGPAASSSHRRQGLCAHRDIYQEART